VSQDELNVLAEQLQSESETKYRKKLPPVEFPKYEAKNKDETKSV
jgi:hypothetical protein